MSEIVEETGVDIRAVNVSDISVNAYNPNEMEAEFFEHLVSAVREEGMNQPILVREDPDNPGKFIVIDGEHRFRAAQVVGLPKVAAVVVPFDDTKSKIRTLSMNAIRGQNVPIKLARVIVDLQQTYTDDQIAAMTGIRKDEQEAVLKLLELPDFDLDSESADFSIGSGDTSRPIPVNLMLMPDEHTHYDAAMQKAMRLGGDDVVVVAGAEVQDYNRAMRESMGLVGVKLRNLALATICEAFNEMPGEFKQQVAEKMKARLAQKAGGEIRQE